MNMITMKTQLLSIGIAGVLCVGGSSVLAQVYGAGGNSGAGGFDPAQMQQQIQQTIMNGYRTQLEITKDDEWAVIQPLIQKILDARPAASIGGNSVGGLLTMLGGGNLRGGGGSAARGGGRGGVGAFGDLLGTNSPEEQALQNAIDKNADSAVLKDLLDKFIAARKVKQAKIDAAQAELRKKLSVRQEALAAIAGLL
jgi:hypothetical protein